MLGDEYQKSAREQGQVSAKPRSGEIFIAPQFSIRS